MFCSTNRIDSDLTKAPPTPPPRTIENTREFDETIVKPTDEEVLEDERTDEFAEFFEGKITPKLLLTTCIDPSQVFS